MNSSNVSNESLALSHSFIADVAFCSWFKVSLQLLAVVDQGHVFLQFVDIGQCCVTNCTYSPAARIYRALGHVLALESRILLFLSGRRSSTASTTARDLRIDAFGTRMLIASITPQFVELNISADAEPLCISFNLKLHREDSKCSCGLIDEYGRTVIR